LVKNTWSSKAAVVLRYFEQLSDAEAEIEAGTAVVSPTTVKPLFNR